MRGRLGKKLHGHQEMVGAWAVGKWEHTDSWLKVKIEASPTTKCKHSKNIFLSHLLQRWSKWVAKIDLNLYTSVERVLTTASWLEMNKNNLDQSKRTAENRVTPFVYYENLRSSVPPPVIWVRGDIKSRSTVESREIETTVFDPASPGCYPVPVTVSFALI